MEQSPEQVRRKTRWGSPPDSDLIGIPLVVGLVVAILAILAAFYLATWAGLILLGVVLVVALAISYRVVMAADIED